jgi:hypothetical protein
MSTGTQLFVLATFLLMGIIVAFIGYDMANSPSVYPFFNDSLCFWLGVALMAVAFVPSAVMAVYTVGSMQQSRGNPAGFTDVFTAPPIPRPEKEPEAPAPGVFSVESVRKGGDKPLVAARSFPHLIGLTGGLPNRVEVGLGIFTIGRAPDCQLVLTSQLVSRHHAQLDWDGERLLLRDMGSSNATLVNDKKVEKDMLLNEGDVIQIVDYSLEVELPPSLAKTIRRSHSGEPDADPAATIRLPLDDA